MRPVYRFLAAWLLAASLAAVSARAEPSPVASTPGEPAAPAAARVMLADEEVFTLQAPLGHKTASERAQQASKALAAAAKEPELGAISVVRQGDLAVVFVGERPIVSLGPADAELAGDQSPEVHAREVAVDVQRALEAEHRRGRIAQQVFAVSLVVFFGLIAFFLMQRVGAVALRLRSWVEANGDKLSLRIRDVEVVRPEMAQSAALVALGLLRWLGMGAVLYAWLVASLSLFGLTAVTEKLTGMVVSPLSELTARVATTVPLLVLGLIAGLSVLLLLRFVELLFAGVAKRETTLAWVPADLALPTSILLRIGIVLAALVFAAPVVTGDPAGVFPRVGLVLLAALALGAVPLVASALVGVVVLFGRRLRLYDWVRIGGVEGRVIGLDLLEVRVQGSGSEECIPMLSLLRMPLTKLHGAPRTRVRLAVAPGADLDHVKGELSRAAQESCSGPTVTLLSADGDALVYEVSAVVEPIGGREQLLDGLVRALGRAGIALGRLPESRR